MRNEMHNFALQPEANIPRSRFDLSQNVKFTGNTGRLIPFYVQEVLPGDTFDVNTSIVCRLQTLIHPLMDNIYLDTYYFFVPNRLVWDNWKHFCGEPNKAWVADREWTVPCINRTICFDTDSEPETSLNAYAHFKDTIFDYMGLGLCERPASAVGLTFRAKLNALPIRAYNKIYDDWFRDENLEDPINLYTGDNDIMTTLENVDSPLLGGKPYMAAKLHDYFTSALPQAQRGNPATLTVGEGISLPVITGERHAVGANPLLGKMVYSTANTFNARVSYESSSTGLPTTLNAVDPGTGSTALRGFYPDNLYADLSNFSLGITVNDLRMAFAVQRWMEKSARGGARYIEIIKTMFGVESPDARLQRSEYLGGHRVPINIHQIVNTTETVDTPLGNTGAMSVTSDVHNDFIHSFVEHGHVIGLCVVRYKHSYPQGFDKMWSRKTIFDYYWPSFAYIGEQPIMDSEIFVDLTNKEPGVVTFDSVFGYNEAWADYRYKPNRVMGEMRPGVPNSLASWHLSDYYESQPILGSSWIKEDIAPVDRAIAVQSSTSDQFLFDILINNKATRPMPLYSFPGLIDHF